MEKNIFKKIFLCSIFCFFILITVPITTGEFIEYPMEEGPYTVFISGQTYGGAVSEPFFWDPAIGFQIGPFCSFKYPLGPEYNMLNKSIFIVNGKIQKYEFPAQIGLKGLKGFAPATNHLTLKILTGGRIRVFGICEVIYLWYGIGTK